MARRQRIEGVTMADVARLAGVSTTTVSHVLNETRPVSSRTRDTVRDAIRRTGYTHNTIARALARASTQSIGLAISAISNPYFADVVAAIEAEATRAGYTLLLGDTHEDPHQELKVVQMLVQRRVDGVLLAPSPGAGQHALRYLAAQPTPVVLIDRLASAAFDQVGTENQDATAQLVEHLADHGHTRIGLISGLEGLPTTDERVHGYRLALARRGLEFDSGLVASGSSVPEAARAAVHRVLDLPNPPTALIAANNHMTIGVMRALADRELRVPADMALVAFDDFEWADLFSPRLTVVAQPCDEIGTQAVALLLSRLGDPTLPPRSLRLPPRFVRRESCGCERAAS